MAGILFLASFSFYLYGACPTLYGGDSGELITSAAILGLPHAPGYPLFNLVFRALSDLIPFGSEALRLNYASSLVSAAVVGLAFEVFRKGIDLVIEEGTAFQKNLSSLSGTLFLAALPIFVDQARVVEVFSLNVLFLLGIFAACLTSRWLIGFFLLGLGLGNHQTLLAAAPVLIFGFLFHRRDIKSWALAGCFFLIGFSVYFYLPLRAAHDPAVNFGDPETWRRFWAVVRRKEFGSLSLHPAALPFRTLETVNEQIFRFLERTWIQIGWAGSLAATACFLSAFAQRKTRAPALIAMAAWFVVGAGFDVFSNLSPRSDIGQWRMERFMMIPLFFLSVLLPVGIAAGFQKRKIWGLVLAAFVVTAALQPKAHATIHFRDNFSFREFGLTLLRGIPKNGVLIIDRVLFDEPTSALLVLTQVEQKRPDVRIYYRPGTLFGSPYGTDILDLSWRERYKRQIETEKKLLQVTDPALVRCLAFEKSNTPFKSSVLAGLVYSSFPNVSVGNPGLRSKRGFPPTTCGNDDRAFHIERYRYEVASTDYPTRLIQIHFPYLAAKAALESGDQATAHRLFSYLLSKGNDMAWLASNVGGLLARDAHYQEAERAFHQAIQNDPYFPDGHFGLGFVDIKRERFAEAISSYETAARLAPYREDYFYMLGIAYAQAGRPSEAVPPWERYLELAPDGVMADGIRMELSMLRTTDKK